MRKKSIPWSDIKSIEFFYLDQYKKQRIVINLEKKKIVFRAEVLNDGCDPFVNWVQDMAMRYHILFNGKILTV